MIKVLFNFVFQTFGTIPWQSYFQRVLSVKTSRQAQVLSVIGGLITFVLVVPALLIGAAGKNASKDFMFLYTFTTNFEMIKF